MIQTTSTKMENPVLHVSKSKIFMCLIPRRAIADEHISLDVSKLSSKVIICHTCEESPSRWMLSGFEACLQ